MLTVEQVTTVLAQIAPPRLAEDWDNVGLLVGDRQQPVEKIMTCLTITPASAAEAIESGVDLIVVHHPLPFRPLKRLTRDTAEGRLLLDLIAARVAIYSAHTAFDSAADGINQSLAEGLGLREIVPLVPADEFEMPVGTGRAGRCEGPVTLGEMAERVKSFLQVAGLHMVGEPAQPVNKVGVACGSAGEMLAAARRAGCDLFITGEARFHTALAAEADQIGLLLPGHFASERFAQERLAQRLARQFPDLTIWPSQRETDPLKWM